MKKNISIHFIALAALIMITVSCKKEKGKNDCKTCMVFGIDQQTIQKEVCSDAQEKAFRDEYAGQEISCQ